MTAGNPLAMTRAVDRYPIEDEAESAPPGSNLGKTGLISLSVAEVRRLTGLLLHPQRLTPTHHLHWSWWRRLSQTHARPSHYERRGRIPQLCLQY